MQVQTLYKQVGLISLWYVSKSFLSCRSEMHGAQIAAYTLVISEKELLLEALQAIRSGE